MNGLNTKERVLRYEMNATVGRTERAEVEKQIVNYTNVENGKPEI